MTSDYLPTKVCVLDLETSKLVRRPAKLPLAFVGISIYDLRGGRHHPGAHRCFFPDDLGELEKLLKDFEGIVFVEERTGCEKGGDDGTSAGGPDAGG